MTGKKLFTIFGFPVHAQFFFWLLILIFVVPAFGDTTDDHIVAVAWAPIIFASILVHELGHAFAIRKLGYGNSKILLWGMGGVCINSRRNTTKHGLLISLAGPFAGLALGVAALPLLFVPLGWVGHAIVINVLTVNIVWSLMNLLPVFPLDGGKVLMYVLQLLGVNSDKSVRVTGLVGLIIIVPAALLSVAYGQIFMLLIIFFIGQSAWQAWRHGPVALRGGL
jgi:Zn-dependent protease